MATEQHHLSTLEEKLIWYGIVLTYPAYILGAVYVIGSLLGWLIFAVAMLRRYVEGPAKNSRITPLHWVWICGMLTMEIALLIGHSNWDLGFAQTLKSSIGWAKGWALLALFVVLGSIVDFKRAMLIRAITLVAAQGIPFGVITLLAYLVHLPGDIYVSPLRAVGGPGDEFFSFKLYGLNPETGAGRWQFFCPWAPAAGFMACAYVVFCLQEQNRFWRYAGILGCITMLLLSQSRAGMAIFPIVIVISYFKYYITRPWLLLTVGILIPTMMTAGEPIYQWAMQSYTDVKQARPNSSRVRATLATLAVQRWAAEAPMFGHGIVERGPKIVEHMPIGSHHSWYGLLFVKGMVGLLALAIPLACTLLYLTMTALNSQIASSALALMGTITCYSFFENLEILSYLYWPAMLFIGIALNPIKVGQADESA